MQSAPMNYVPVLGDTVDEEVCFVVGVFAADVNEDGLVDVKSTASERYLQAASKSVTQ